MNRIGRRTIIAIHDTHHWIRGGVGPLGMKFSNERPYADPEKAARKRLEIANATEAPHEGRIHIEKINGPFLFKEGASPAEYTAGSELAVARGRLVLHESGTFVKFTSAGAECLRRAIDMQKKYRSSRGNRARFREHPATSGISPLPKYRGGTHEICFGICDRRSSRHSRFG